MSNDKVEPDRPKPKDRWDKADVILKFVGGVLTAAVIAGLGWWGSGVLENQRISDAKTRLYTELMSKREESDNSLRKDMFVNIINSFLKTDQTQGKQDLEPRVLELELLAYNFHESLNLKPLFIHLRRQIEASNKDGKDYLDRMEKVAGEIVDKQMLVLEEAAGSWGKRELGLDLSGVPRTDKPRDENSEPLHLEGCNLKLVDTSNKLINRNVEITVLESDPKRKEIKVRVEIRTPSEAAQVTDGATESPSSESPPAKFIQPINRELSVGPFDFPFIDNIRLSNDQRLALVLKDFSDEQKPVITLVLFPGSHASLREKPFFQEIIQKLQLGGK